MRRIARLRDLGADSTSRKCDCHDTPLICCVSSDASVHQNPRCADSASDCTVPGFMTWQFSERRAAVAPRSLYDHEAPQFGIEIPAFVSYRSLGAESLTIDGELPTPVGDWSLSRLPCQ